MRHAFRLALWIVLVLVAAAVPAGAAAGPAALDAGAVETATAQVRGLVPSAAVAVVPLSREQLRDVLLTRVATDSFRGELSATQTAWTLLGLLPPGFDLQGTLLAVAREQVVGFYSPEDKQIYLVQDAAVSDAQAEIVLAHEYTHALQDQHYELARLLPSPPANDDVDLAHRALVEGDATVTMARYAQQHLSLLDLQGLVVAGGLASRALNGAPAAVRAELLFPYLEGATFVQALLAASGPAGLDAAFQQPPASTEQVLHPEKYVAAEPPVEVALPDLAARLGPNWRLVGGGVLGELGWRSVLRVQLAADVADPAAAGWGGDRWVVLEDSGGRAALVLASTWDTPADAGESFNALGAALARRYGVAADAASVRPSELELTGADGIWNVRVAGDRALAVMAPDRPTLAALQAALASGA